MGHCGGGKYKLLGLGTPVFSVLFFSKGEISVQYPIAYYVLTWSWCILLFFVKNLIDLQKICPTVSENLYSRARNLPFYIPL